MRFRLANMLLMASVTASGCALGGDAAPSIARSQPVTATTETVATGSFEVTLTPSSAPGDTVASMKIAKTFHGDLAGSSTGQMLAVRTAVEGSAGYVAMERVEGALGGREGSFALLHSGSMDKGAQSLSIAVVPDSGSGGLAGLAGTMDIRVENGKHFYTFRYSLP